MPLLGKRSRTRRQSEPLPPGPPTSSPVRSSSIPPSSPPRTPVRTNKNLSQNLENQPSTQNQALALLQNYDESPSIDAIVITSLDVLPFCCHGDLCSMSKSELVRVARALNNKLPGALKINLGDDGGGGGKERRWIRKEIEKVVDIKAPDTASEEQRSQKLASALNIGISASVSEPPPAPKPNRMGGHNPSLAHTTKISEAASTTRPPALDLNTVLASTSPTSSLLAAVNTHTPRTPRRSLGPFGGSGTSFYLGTPIPSVSFQVGTPVTPSFLGTPTLERLDEVEEDEGGDDEDGRPTKKRRKVSAATTYGERPFRERTGHRTHPHPLSEALSASLSQSSLGSLSTLQSLNQFDESGSESEQDGSINVLATPTPAASTSVSSRSKHKFKSMSLSMPVPLSARNDTPSPSNLSRGHRWRSKSLSLYTDEQLQSKSNDD
ncbi:hypothetical protein VKT23_003642 [Stygiomarasmius scandens]|uniref:Uncharacterized protein n=1 Tax=Marasmiellus scandens TaxID=2682957 RepID=A0ABR1JXV7_9AGAR